MAMRLVIQRVDSASVTNHETGKVVGKIGKGLFVLVGVGEGDKNEDAEKLADKLFKMRIMADEQDKMNLSVADVKGQILAVSQFTLYADTTKGNRPSFIKAAAPDIANNIYEHFIGELKKRGIKVETGEFGAYMKIKATLDGPVTILL